MSAAGLEGKQKYASTLLPDASKPAFYLPELACGTVSR